jgi:RNA-binding protein
MKPLLPTERRALRAKAHHLEPVVTVGHHGLTPAVLHEIDLALLAHDLVKVKVLGDDREAREAMLAKACETLDCAAVQHVGKVLVLWRPNPERKKKAPEAAQPAKSARKPARKRTGPRSPVDPVRERRRAAKTAEENPTSDQARRRRRTV